MNVRTVLLKVVEGSSEGWQVMDFDEFLGLVNLRAWSAKELVVAIVLPPLKSVPMPTALRV